MLVWIIFLHISLILNTYSPVGFAAPLEPAQSKEAKQTILIIHSYNPKYEWTSGQDHGISNAFTENLDQKAWQLKRIYLNEKEVSSDEKAKAVENAKLVIDQLHPRGAILTDDFAFKSLYRFLREREIPVSFSGINGNLADYGYKAGEPGIAGSLERYNIPSVLKIVKRLRPTVNSVLLISDDDITGTALKNDIKDQIVRNPSLFKMGITHLYDYASKSYEGLKKRLSEVDEKTTAVIMSTFYAYRDEKNKPVNYKDIEIWVKAHTRFLDVGTAAFNVKNGRLISIASSEVETGHFSGEILFRAILEKRDLATFGIRSSLPLQLMLNHERGKTLGIRFPFDLLAYAGNAEKLSREVKK